MAGTYGVARSIDASPPRFERAFSPLDAFLFLALHWIARDVEDRRLYRAFLLVEQVEIQPDARVK